MAVDLELLAAEDADFLLDDAATAESPARGEPDDAMMRVWGNLEAQGGGGAQAAAAWWDLSLGDGKVTDTKTDAGLEPVELLLDEQEVELTAFVEPSRSRETISPVAIESKQNRTKVNSHTAVAAATRQVAISEDSQPESERKPVTRATRTPRNSKQKGNELVVKIEPNAAVKGKEGKGAKVQRKRKPATAQVVATSATVTVKEEKKLTPLEIRRKRNRESMQRARRRQRDDIERMKLTLQQLEKHYQELNEKSQAKRRRASSSNSNGDSDSTTLEANYCALADLSHTLKEEKFLLEQMLVEKQKTHRRFQQVMVDRKQELELACPLTTDDSTLFTDYEYVPMTEDQANEHIRNCYQQMRAMEETVKPLMSPFEVSDGDSSDVESPSSPSTPDTPQPSNARKGCAFPPSATFGWEVRHETNPDGDFYVSFSKFFVGITPQQAMVSSWRRDSKPTSTPFRRKLRFEVLQVINDSTYIAGTDIEHPVQHDKVMRMIFLNFRMQTDKGYVIGRHSINPSSPEVREMAERDSNFEYVDNSNWVEFSAGKDERTGEPGCLVKFIARTEYNTQEDMYVRLVNSISRTMIWELAVVPSSSRSLLLPS
ncbi:hypothetical protein L914_14356 [Phytophthora nicotianae]|uniref:BZIP domain-containing protein n=1 Tax=Phytophthora nicotianae TaxID=4792 RepID=W2MV30_PHYNI|nr:hypothetical protein L914_14356 [Phytophthora nicotianae]